MADGMTTLVVVPQAEEFEPLVRAVRGLGHRARAQPVGRCTVTVFDGLKLGIAVCGHGKVQLGVQAQHLLDALPQASTLLCAGAAGALTHGLRRGDVVVGSRCVEHDYKPRFAKAPAPVHAVDSATARGIFTRGSQLAGRYRVHHGPIASGDEDVVDPVRAHELHVQTGALCVAWEGAGAARAAAFSGRAFVEVRAITDAADENAALDFRDSLESAMPNLADVLAAWATARGGSR